jgi:hypothetical protein
MRQNDVMKSDATFELAVGSSEKHQVVFDWAQFWGVAKIRVDGVEVLRERHVFGGRKTMRFEVPVGQ